MLNQKKALAIFVLTAILISPVMQVFAVTNGEAATTVIGKPDFTTGTYSRTTSTGTSATAFDFPTSISFDSSGNLWVADQSNNRVLMFANTGSTISNTASVVIGQPDFTSRSTGTSATALGLPTSISFDSSGNLWVADQSNNRVLMFARSGTTISSTASIVIGQPDFTTGTSGTTSTKLFDPTSISFDSSGNLWVADFGNDRVLMFANTGSTISNTASVVIGQPDFTSR